MSNAIQVKDLNKSFHQGKEDIHVIKNLSFDVKEGEIIALMGESGSGKSTLLQILGGLQNFDSGEINILGQNIKTLNDSKKTELRLKNIGFVYQYHHLLSDFTALENVMIPQLIARETEKFARTNAMNLLDKLGLSDRISHRPAELSGGQQQRVAIARALANSPKLLFADEPTGNLDSANASVVMDLFLNLAREKKTTLVIATHSGEISKKTDRIFRL
jgi:lipoprotein-releasing system ATP-binding protein